MSYTNTENFHQRLLLFLNFGFQVGALTQKRSLCSACFLIAGKSCRCGIENSGSRFKREIETHIAGGNKIDKVGI